MSPDLLRTLRIELDARLHELRALRSEYDHLLSAAEELGVATDRAAPPPPGEKTLAATQRSRARTGAARHAILAALARGPHTTSQLVRVTGFRKASVRYNLHRMLRLGAVSRTERSGQTVWHALPDPDRSALQSGR